MADENAETTDTTEQTTEQTTAQTTEASATNNNTNNATNGAEAAAAQTSTTAAEAAQAQTTEQVDVEALKTQLAQLQTENETHRLRALEIDVRESIVARQDLRYPAIVADLVVAQSGKLTAKDGKIEGLETVLTDLKTKHPNLFFDSPGSADGGAHGAASADDGNAWFRSTFNKKK